MDRQRAPEEPPREGEDRRGASASRWLAWALCGLCVALAAGSLLFAALNGRTPGEVLVADNVIAIAILAVAFGVVGALIAAHRPGNAIGWIFCAAAFCQGLINFGYEYAFYALLTRPGSLPLGPEMSWIGNWIWAPGLGLILVFLPLLFPDGHLPSRRWRPVAWLGAASIAAIAAPASILLWPERGVALLRPPTTEEGDSLWVLDLIVDAFAFPLMLTAGLAAVVSLFVRFRRARGDERQQIKWFAYAAALTLLWTFLVEGIPDSSQTFEATTAVLAVLVIPSIPVATGIAIFRHRLYDIDRLINRTLVYAALTGTLAAVYVGGVVVLQSLFRALAGGGSSLAVVASTLAIAALFNPLRRGIQALIDRRLYRRKYDAAKVLQNYSGRLRDETDLDRLGEALVVAARETVQPAHAALWLREAPAEAAVREPA